MQPLSSMKLGLFSFAMLAALVGCAPSPDESTDDLSGSTVSAADAAKILDLANYPDTDEALLDSTIKLDSRAAKNIVEKRNGPDGLYPSADDAPFTSLADLEAVSYVGTSAIGKLRSYAVAHPAPASESVEGVGFSGWQSVAVVWGVNHATASDLDAFLDSRAAKALVAGAPYANVAQMGPISFVGASALSALKTHALGYWTASKAPSGFVLDAATLATDTQMLKESLVEDEGFVEFLQTLTNGDNTEGVAIVTALDAQIDKLTAPLLGQTFADADAAEAAVVAAAPVKANTKSGGWAYLESIGVTPPAALACVASFEVAVSPELGQLLFLSESDRPFDVVTFVGAGNTAPTAGSVMALVNPEADSTAQIRPTSNFYDGLEPSDSPASAAIQSEFGTLTDVTYVAVFKPMSDPYNAEVDVYLVGRTSCGDLVGIHAIAIET